MARVLHAKTVAAADTFATKNTTGDDLWVGFDIYMVTMPTSGGSGTLISVGSAGFVDDGGLYLTETPPWQWDTYYSTNGPFGGPLVAGEWYHVDYHFASGAPVQEALWLQCIDQGEAIEGDDVTTLTRVSFGWNFAASIEDCYLANLTIGTTRGGTDVWSTNLAGTLGSEFDSTTVAGASVLEIIEDPTGTLPDDPCAPPVPSIVDRCERVDWRFIITDTVTGAPITILDGVALDRSITKQLNVATQVSFSVPSGNPEINLVHTDGFPFLAEGDRDVYCFRRDYDGGVQQEPYKCRAAARVLQINDNAGPNGSHSTVTAWDPWQLLYRLPVVNVNEDAADAGTHDTTYTDTPGNIITDLLINAEIAYSFPSAYGLPIDYGSGTIESLPSITITFQKDSSIGEAFDQLCSRGVCDIVLEPLYDPANKPGALAVLNVYALAGAQQPEAIFAWDRPSHSIVRNDRLIDGNLRANNIRFHLGQGGSVTEEATEGASITRFGDYYLTQFFVAAEQDETLAGFADQIISDLSEHQATVSFDPLPDNSPIPFLEYDIGDSVQVYSSRAFRATQSGFQRVVGFRVDITDNGTEMIRDLMVYIPDESEEVPLAFDRQQQIQTSLAQGATQVRLTRQRTVGTTNRPTRR